MQGKKLKKHDFFPKKKHEMKITFFFHNPIPFLP